MNNSILIQANGEIKEVSPKGKKFSLEELQAFVGGYIELVYLSKEDVLVVNEEGIIKGLPINRMATALFSLTLDANVELFGDILLAKLNLV